MYNFESNFHTLKTVSHYKMGCYFHHLALVIDDLGTDYYYYYYYYYYFELGVDFVVASEVYEFVAFCLCMSIYNMCICMYICIYLCICMYNIIF